MKNQILYRELFGIVFYYFENPNKIKNSLLEFFDEVIEEPFLPKFSRLSEDGERFKAFKMDSNEYIKQLLLKHDFERSLFFCLTDASKTKVHSARLEFMGRKIREEYASKSPNYIYLEISNEVDIDLIWNLFYRAWYGVPFFLAYGNIVAAPHMEHMPKSGSQAAKRLRSSDKLTKGFFEIWGNPAYRQTLEAGNKCLEGVNQFVGLGANIKNYLFSLYPNILAEKNYTIIPSDHFCLLRADSIPELKAMRSHLQPLFCDLPKPRMFWKEDHWGKWVNQTRNFNRSAEGI